MEVLGLMIALFVLGLFGWGVVTMYNQRQSLALDRSPGRALATGDHWYKQSLRFARLISQVQGNELLWPILPQELRDEVDAELKRFWDDSSN